MPDAIAALTKLVKKAKTETETEEQINKRKSNLANNNRKMAASAAAGNLSSSNTWMEPYFLGQNLQSQWHV